MILRAPIRPKDDPDAEPEWIRTEAPDYYTARDQLIELTPEGWVRLYLITGDE